MKVLVTEFDIFNSVGGGQTVYRRLIETNPSIDFHYLRRDETPDATHPANAHPINHRPRYAAPFFDYWELDAPAQSFPEFLNAMNIAASVAEMEFDVVESADYQQFGLFLRPALEHHGVRFGRHVVSMHGNVSVGSAMNWDAPGVAHFTFDLIEQFHFRSADLRYGISRDYIDHWATLAPLPAAYVDPRSFLRLPEPTLPPTGGPPKLLFVARSEKWKGPDLFVELLNWLPAWSHGGGLLVGPEHICPHTGARSFERLRKMAENRSIDLQIAGPILPSEVTRLFSDRVVTVLPSRWDTLNLTALESLFSGCPTALGTPAGACRFLREEFPSVPFLPLDVDNLYDNLPALVDLLDCYDARRNELFEALARVDRSPFPPVLPAVYAGETAFDADVRRRVRRWFDVLLRHYYRFSTPRRGSLLRLARRASPAFIPQAGSPTDDGSGSRDSWHLQQHAFCMQERTSADFEAKLGWLWNLSTRTRVDRVPIWREIARMERVRGNSLLAATYELRVMRSQGVDPFGDLLATTTTLERLGFREEARAARALFGPGADNVETPADILRENIERFRRNPAPDDYEIFDDRRGAQTRRVSVVVSLYNAEAKLPLFLRLLARQEMFRRREAELVLVDSGSPQREYDVFRGLQEARELPILYARSANRETIQSAWNRGIRLARAPYLAFLGVDETVVPGAFDILAGELDVDQKLDWVIGKSLVTEVSSTGTLVRDVMPYDRTGYRQHLVYLETCYLSWVGALYRKSIHDRFGYYDPSFRGAGDTEFKSRVLDRLRTKAVQRNLGIFLNYPDERTTQSPHAEIEDLRAWYLPRSRSGLDHIFRNLDVDALSEVIRSAFRYRKSYRLRDSTDVEFAANALDLLRSKAPDTPLASHAGSVAELLVALRRMDRVVPARPAGAHRALHAAQETAATVKAALAADPVSPLDAPLLLFNDNRFEQHTEAWRGVPGSFPSRHRLQHRWTGMDP